MIPSRVRGEAREPWHQPDQQHVGAADDCVAAEANQALRNGNYSGRSIQSELPERCHMRPHLILRARCDVALHQTDCSITKSYPARMSAIRSLAWPLP